MEQVTLRAETGRETGSRSSRRMRREGKVLGVVYGSEMNAVPVAVDRRELYAALHTEAGLNAIITLVVGDKSVTTVAREIQRHPVRGTIDHLDFIKINLDEAIEAVVGIDFEGEPLGVRQQGGILETINNTVNISALPTNIPSSIALDVTDLEIGDALRVEDLPQLDGVEYLDDQDTPLVTVSLPAAEIEEEEEDIEGLEGEEVEGEEASADDTSEDASDEDEG